MKASPKSAPAAKAIKDKSKLINLLRLTSKSPNPIREIRLTKKLAKRIKSIVILL